MNKDIATQIKEAFAAGDLELANKLIDSQIKPSRQPKTAAKKAAKKTAKKTVKKTTVVRNIPPGAVQGSGKNLFNPREFAREAEVVNAAAFDKKVKRKKGYKRPKKEPYQPVQCFCRGCGQTFDVPPALAVEKYRCNDCITKPFS